MYKKKLIILIFILIAVKSYANNNQFSISKVIIPANASAQEIEAGNLFVKLYFSKYKKTIFLEKSNSITVQENSVILKQDTTFVNDGFCIKSIKNNIVFSGNGHKMLSYAVYYFFEEYLSRNKLSNNINDCKTPDFNYREAYFYQLYNTKFLLKNKLNNLEDYWGIWGHNLAKVIKRHPHTNAVYATENNVKNKSQFCFSSKELEAILTKEVANSGGQGNYMIAPNDNLIVCTCNTCKKIGNTKDDASPSVFYLLRKMARKYPKANFYTIAYHTVKKSPKLKLPANTGVFFSTIKYQEGIPFTKAPKFKTLQEEIVRWKTTADNLFIWDYVLNFDNYNDFYPMLFSTQQNLQLYKSLGVKGVFFNGSEEYSILQKLKATILSKLLWDTSLNITKEIKSYFHENYPPQIASLLTEYYLSIEKKSYQSTYANGIYTSIERAKKKYLDAKSFNNFFTEFEAEFLKIDTPTTSLTSLMTSLTILKLELIRTSMLENLCDVNAKKSLFKLLAKLKKNAQKANIFYINEAKQTVNSYVQQWYNLILTYSCTNTFLNKPFKVLSSLDEGYNNPKILNDGNIGFLDYNTNWLIVSKDDLIIEIEGNYLKNKQKIKLGFLNDSKHKIYTPKYVKIISGKEILNKIKVTETNKKKKVVVQVPINGIMSTIKIIIKRRTTNSKSALACDEIILKN